MTSLVYSYTALDSITGTAVPYRTTGSMVPVLVHTRSTRMYIIPRAHIHVIHNDSSAHQLTFGHWLLLLGAAQQLALLQLGTAGHRAQGTDTPLLLPAAVSRSERRRLLASQQLLRPVPLSSRLTMGVHTAQLVHLRVAALTVGPSRRHLARRPPPPLVC
jgi:hypothetical protein